MIDTPPPVRKAGKPLWPKIPPGFVRSVLAGHSALGLAFAALIYLVCFSGTVAVFAHEFQRWERPAAPMVHSVTPAAVQRTMEQAQVAFGQPAEHINMILPTPELPRLVVTADVGHGQVERTWYADALGTLASDGEATWTRFMSDLHIYLHLPRSWGMFVVGLTGVALLSSLISGILAHPRVFKDAFHLRWGGSKRLQEADLHNRAGVWALPFHLVVSLTGALLGLTTFVVGVLAMVVFQGDMNKVYEMFIGPAPIDDPRGAPLPNLVGMLETVERLSPGSLPTYVGVEHPNERGQGAYITARQPDRLAYGDAFTFGPGGALIRHSDIDRVTVGERILNVLGPLHFGWFGGWPIKIAYGVLGAGLTAVTSSGVAIWLARRRDKGRPAPRWERIWIATVWSQPLAYAVSLLVAVLAPTFPPLAAWAGATVLALSVSGFWTVDRISARLRALAGVLLIVTAGLHGVLAASSPTDPIAWVVDLVLATLGLALIATAVPRRWLPGGRARRALPTATVGA